MKRPVRWSRDALDELIATATFVARENPRAAQAIAKAIRAAGRRLSELQTGRPGRVPGTHEKLVPGLPYILVYVVDPETSSERSVVILRVVHASRDGPDGELPPLD